jgi:GNAT superfamily N-acetyltransferase
VPAVSQVNTAGYVLLAKQEEFTEWQLLRLLMERCSKRNILEWPLRWECFVAESEGDTVGALAIEGNAIAELWVTPDYHRRGIGTALFEKAAELIAARGHDELTLRSANSDTAFFEAMGLTVAGKTLCNSGPLEGRELIECRKTL